MKDGHRSTRRTALIAFAAVGIPRIALPRVAPRIVIGAVAAGDSVPVWYANEAGLFRRAGLDVAVERAANGSAAILGVLSGNYNVANTNLLSLISAHTRGISLTTVSFNSEYDGTADFDAALIRKDAPLRIASDLNGRVFGSSSVNDLFGLGIRSWMDSRGGDSKTLKFVEVPLSLIVPALEEHRIDIGGAIQPFLSTDLASGKFRVFCATNEAIAPRFALTAWVANSKWLAANPDAVRRFAWVLREAKIYCNGHRTETALILAENTAADLQTILRGGRDTFSETIADPRELQPLIDVAAKYGAIDRRFDAGELISPVVRSL